MVDRRVRPARRDHLGPALRRLPRIDDLRPARHDRHRVPVPDDKVDRFAALLRPRADKPLSCVDDPETSPLPRAAARSCRAAAVWSAPPPTTSASAQMLLNGGELDGVRVLGRKTVELMTHQPPARWWRPARSSPCPAATARSASTAWASGSPWPSARARSPTRPSARRASSCGAARRRPSSGSTPPRSSIVVFMTQLMPSGTFNFRGQLKSLVYPAIVD